jgi:hypothetical protein
VDVVEMTAEGVAEVAEVVEAMPVVKDAAEKDVVAIEIVVATKSVAPEARAEVLPDRTIVTTKRKLFRKALLRKSPNSRNVIKISKRSLAKILNGHR